MRVVSLGFLSISLLATSAIGCGDHDWHHRRYGHGADNEVIFGIRQSTDAAGKREVRASYEYLSIAHRGGSRLEVFRDGDGDGTCYYERFDERIGTAPVDDGVAVWTGGLLPASGLQVLANQTEPARFDGPGWSTGQELTFDVSGFALPRIPRESMPAPAAELTVTGVTPPVGEGGITLASTSSIAVTWQATAEREPTRVMLSLDTEEPNSAGGGLRCFASAKSGSAVIPAEWVARLFSGVPAGAALTGTLGVSTHRQLSIAARGGWMVYAVATTLHQEHRWTSSR